DVPDAVEKLITTYLDLRRDEERFADTVLRVGLETFRAGVYDQPREERKTANA
ncbi:MAG: hypothetical protein JNM82_07290, partial [Rhodocyclaceae bacterium]|nr:hypothetical protein [Rhodocyclaceae bacterium]